MATVTFIIGNGLDLSLGLRTTYKDFYKYVIAKKPKTNNRIYAAINDDPESWGDFEARLGEYT